MRRDQRARAMHFTHCGEPSRACAPHAHRRPERHPLRRPRMSGPHLLRLIRYPGDAPSSPGKTAVRSTTAPGYHVRGEPCFPDGPPLSHSTGLGAARPSSLSSCATSVFIAGVTGLVPWAPGNRVSLRTAVSLPQARDEPCGYRGRADGRISHAVRSRLLLSAWYSSLCLFSDTVRSIRSITSSRCVRS